jgi:hypothetical protein
MNTLDLFFKKYSYKFPKGYPDLNDEQDVKILNNLLEGMGINLNEKEKPESKDYDSEILNLLTTLSDEEAKNKVIKYLEKINKKEDKEDEEVEKELEKELKLKEFNKETTEYVLLLASKYNITEELEDYLKSNKLLSFNDLNKKGNLYDLIKVKTDFPEGFIKRIIGYTPSEGNKSLGIGEIALALFFDAKKQKVGDIKINDKMIELKGSNARFPGIGIGRSGDISLLYQDLAKIYPGIKLKSRDSSLSTYITKILTQNPDSLDFINNELDKLYPNADNIKLKKEDIPNIKNILYKKYITNYINLHPENNYYMLISSNTFNYDLYTPDELIDSVEKGNIPFKSITLSSSYPQLQI